MHKKIKNTILLSIFFFIILALSSVAFFEIIYRNSFYPGVNVAGISVNGKNYSEVYTYFKNKADLINKNGLTFNVTGVNGTKQLQVPTFSQGMTTDKVVENFSVDNWESTIKNAYNQGRQGSLWQRAQEQYKNFLNDKNFVFLPVVTKDSINSFFKDQLNGFKTKTVQAEFFIDKGNVSVFPEFIGETVDAEKITNAIYENLKTLNASPINLKTEKDIPLSTEKNLTPFLGLAENIKNSLKIKFLYNNYSWNVTGVTIISWLTIKQDGKIGINRNKLEDYFYKTVIFYIDSPMENSRFEMQNNKLVEIFAGKSGNTIDLEKNAQNIEDAISKIFDSNMQIDLLIATDVKEPKITKETIDQYKIVDLVGTATTSFKGSSIDRKQNIKTGTAILNGILLAPGEEFSAVNNIGYITEEAGFVKEFVIKNGKTEKELGGGLCQLATTLFRLALNSGLPITERSNHRYVVPYYGAGLDATIYGPHPDLRFINDTENFLLLQGKVSDNELTFEFYGKKDGRIAEISTPKFYNKIDPPETKYIPTPDLPANEIKCSETPHAGITADATYTVTYSNGKKQETKFHSVYQPWQEVCFLGTGT